MNIFLRQEIDRMQRVITAVRNTLVDLKLAIDGTIIMSENLKDALDNIYDARVPALWKKVTSGFQSNCRVWTLLRLRVLQTFPGLLLPQNVFSTKLQFII